ncbi:MAG: hypothetical protein LIO99_01340 [Clostridiales bacterium]|nr:hypothetical protein [Clostridiales bacterium]
MMLDKEIESYIMKEYGINSSEGYKAERLRDGLSGADVFMLELISPRRNRDIGTYVLKVIDTTSQWYDPLNNEIMKTQSIYNEAVPYQKHLVKVTKNGSVGNRLVMVLTYALGKRRDTLPMEKLSLDGKIGLLELISYELLKELNKDSVKPVSDGNMIRELCGYRLEENGRFCQRVNQYLRNPKRSAMRINENVFPNPAFYVPILKNVIAPHINSYLLGIVHGDLHQKNILISENGKKYAIIDYDSCKENYLFFDQAYLELNCYNTSFADWDLNKWADGMRHAFQVEDDPEESIEYYSVINIEKSIRHGIEKWCAEENPYNLDNVQLQLELARIAAGINFFSKAFINNQIEHIKFLIYIGCGLEKLFSLISYNWDREDISELGNKKNDEKEKAALWEECGRFRDEYIKILVTDDTYAIEQYPQLQNIANIGWRLIVDVGSKPSPEDLVSALQPVLKNVPISVSSEKPDLTPNHTGFLSNKRGTLESDFDQWKRFRKNIGAIINKACSAEPLKAVLFVLDLHGNGIIHKKLGDMLLEDELISAGSRLIYLDNCPEIGMTGDELEQRSICFYTHDGLDLGIVSELVDSYGISGKQTDDTIFLPCIDSLDGSVSVEEWNDYSSYVELLYIGMEERINDYSDGRSFYKGNEISWADLALGHDVRWSEYETWKDVVLEKLKKGKTAECVLAHAAGSGGTTLSKRLMWDLKDTYPSLRMRKYSPDAVNVLISIYRKTGKCMFIVVEMGSSVVSEEEFKLLKSRLVGSSCRAVFLKVERIGNEEKQDICLDEELELDDAKKFLMEYCSMTDAFNRQDYLRKITYDAVSDEWRGQRCAFFYGFYTFQEEYEGLGHFLDSSLADCSNTVKDILRDMALITLYSQNICMPVREVALRMGVDNCNIPLLYATLGKSIERLLTIRDNGFRICHPLIAKRLLEILDGNHKNYNEILHFATLKFIENVYTIYTEVNREYVDKIFKELFIDRSYMDGEQQKFALLINDLGKQTYKVSIFEKLIEYYPDNPHYYNHLGRLEVYDDRNLQFGKAVNCLTTALKVCNENCLDETPHLTTLGCIYSRKVKDDLPAGRERTVKQCLDAISVDFSNASSQFGRARFEREDSSYAYFPNILMICNVVKNISRLTGKTLNGLLEDQSFAKWYNRYSGIAVQLYEEMRRKCGDDLSEDIRRKAEDSILFMKDNIDHFRKQLEWAKKNLGVRECCNLRRSTTMLYYKQNKFRWEGMREEDLKYIEIEMEQVLKDGEYNQNDVVCWFNIYRQMDGFDSGRAKQYLQDYMEEGYYKNYLLWILSFKEYIDGLASYKQVEAYLNACRYNGRLIDDSIRTSRFLDVYTMDENKFPIRKFSNKEDEGGEYPNFRIFEGQIVRIEGTVKGEIRLDGKDEILITFTPSFMADDVRHEFTRADCFSRVRFNLVFTYSGYRAWNPVKI